MTDVSLEYSIPAGTNKYLIVHGDMINDRDWPYRFWRRASKNPLTKLGVALIPGGMARRFVEDIEKRLSTSNFKHKSRLPVELMKQYGLKRSREGFTHVVFGHFHNKTVLESPSSTVTVLPPWYEHGEAMEIDTVTGGFSFVKV